MITTLDEVIETVRDARAGGPDALAAMALSFGATMVLGTVRCRALRGQIAEMRAALEATEATVATLRAERDAAREALAAQDSAPDLDYPARAEVWKLRESVEALRARAERAVQEREAFSLRLSAAERERDEARARVEAIAVERNAIVSELSQTIDAMMQARAERDAALARPTYEARTVAPTQAELDAHASAGGAWLVAWMGPDAASATLEDSRIPSSWSCPPDWWIALDARRLPCAWPVVP